MQQHVRCYKVSKIEPRKHQLHDLIWYRLSKNVQEGLKSYVRWADKKLHTRPNICELEWIVYMEDVEGLSLYS